MVSVDKAVIARISRGGKDFEILVDPEGALEFRKGKPAGIENILAVPMVFRDAKKGEKASTSDLTSAFSTSDVFAIAKTIIKEGEVQLTTEQKRKLTEEKRRQLADIISRQGVDPKTRLPHPPARILNAMEQARFNVDPFRPAEAQVKDALEAIQKIIPISIETVEIAIRIPLAVAAKAAAAVHHMARIRKEEWQGNAWLAVLEIPAGLQAEIYSKLNSLTGGQVEVKVLGAVK